MPTRTSLDDLLKRTTERTGQDEQAARLTIETFLDEIYQSMKHGESVTIRDFGGFYVRPHERNTWVFKFNPSQKWKSLFGWSSSYTGDR